MKVYPDEDSNIIDIAFLIDGTGSMNSYINETILAVKGLIDIAVNLNNGEGLRDVRFGVVGYVDH